MNCPSCGSNVNQGEIFCRVCGTKIVSQSVQQNTMVQSNENQQNYAQSQYIYNNYSNDEALINAYIGKNADKLKNGGFSVCTFFFGNIYVLYRKMWLLGIIWFLVSMIISMFLSSLSSILTLVACIVFSTQFNKWYLKHVEEKVAKIKSENPNASHEQLLMLCTQKGGTTVIPIIVVVILYIVLFGIVFLAILGGSLEESKENSGNLSNEYTDTSTSTTGSGNIGDLSLTIPSTLERSKHNTDSYKSYSINDDKDYCRLTISTTNASYYESVSSYLEKNVYYSSSDVASTIETKNINGNNWNFMSVQKSYSKTYYYAGQKNDKIYNIEFSITDDSGVCSSAYSTVIDSIRFN